jgi:peptide/nickel transport system permease protein
MKTYLLRRVVRGLAVLLAVSILSFAIFELAPGDFLTEARLNPRISKDTLEALRSDYSLDRPLLVKYWAWLLSMMHGDWGVSIASNLPVAPLLQSHAWNTLLLTVPSTVLAWTLAVPLGVWSAATPGKSSRLLFSGGLSLLIAVPDLLIVLALMVIVVKTNLLPPGGMASVTASQTNLWTTSTDILAHLILPVTALTLTALPPLVAHVRRAMEEVLEAPFVKAARASGIPRTRLLYRHALPAAANPLVSLFGFSIGTLLSSSLLVEATLDWPGLGQLLLDAALQRDYYVVIGVVMVSGVFMIAGNILADVLLFVADPRIRRLH